MNWGFLIFLGLAVFSKAVNSQEISPDLDEGNSTGVSAAPKQAEEERVDITTEMFEKEFLRHPVVIAVDSTSDNLKQVQDLWKVYHDPTVLDEGVILSVFGASGPLRSVLCNSSREFLEMLDNLIDSTDEEQQYAAPIMRTVLNSLQEIPFDSATLLFTGRKASDQESAQQLTQTLIRKRCRMYVIWTGLEDSQDELILQDISENSGGRLSYISKEMDLIMEHSMADLKEVLVSKLDRATGPSEMRFSLENNINSVYIKIRGRISAASLTDPQGKVRDLFSYDKLNMGDNFLDAEVDATPGMWSLYIDQRNDEDEYDVEVLARIISTPEAQERSSRSNKIPRDVRNSTYDHHDVMERFRFPEKELEVEITENARVETTTVKRNDSLRIAGTAAEQKNAVQAAVPVSVELASGTSLELRPGSSGSLQFELKSNVNLPVTAFVSARGENVFIQNLQPQTLILQPQTTAIVQVGIVSQPGIQSSGIGTVVLSVQAANKLISRRAMIYFSTIKQVDNYAPQETHRYEGDCRNYDQPKTCENGQWTVEATFKDEDTGLLKIMSEPYGLLYRSEFVAGTKSPVTVSYTTTCCQAKVDVWAEDLRGNFIKKEFDVFHQGLLAGEIAAIVVGVLLLIIIIVVIVLTIVIVRKKKRDQLVLPRHGSARM